MYDSIVCKYPLPMPEDPKGYTGSREFQSKDLDCALSCYEIREDGSIWEEERETEYVPGNDKGKSFWDKIGHLKTIKTWYEPRCLNDFINIYDYQQNNDGNYDYDIEYRIRFENGKIVEVKLVDFEAIDNTNRKKQHEENEQTWRKWIEYKKTYRYKYFMRPYLFVTRKIFYYLHSTLQTLDRWVFKIERIARL